MQSAVKKGLFQLPTVFPKKRILSFDIGGTLAKVAYYVPKDDPKFQDPACHEKLTKETIPCNNILSTYLSSPLFCLK